MLCRLARHPFFFAIEFRDPTCRTISTPAPKGRARSCSAQLACPAKQHSAQFLGIVPPFPKLLHAIILHLGLERMDLQFFYGFLRRRRKL
jgi:hypothetical protein